MIGDYYSKKIQAYRFIDEQLKKGLGFDVILYKVQTQFGFSKKFVKERIELIEKLTGGEVVEKPKKKDEGKK